MELKEVILSKENLNRAYKKVVSNKGVSGVDTRINLKGVVFGKLSGKYAVMPETTDGHILVVGGAGSGKTASIAIPTLMSWKERVFAIDIKGELYQKTGKSRGFGYIKVFNPTDEGAFGYDPFYMLRNATDVSSEARQIAMSICPLPPDTKDPFWIKSAQNLLTGLIMYFLIWAIIFRKLCLQSKQNPLESRLIPLWWMKDLVQRKLKHMKDDGW